MYYQCQKCRELLVDQQPCKCDKKWVILICFIFVKLSFIAFCYNLLVRSSVYGISTFTILLIGIIALILSFFYCRSDQNDRIPLNMTLLQVQQNPQHLQQIQNGYVNQFRQGQYYSGNNYLIGYNKYQDSEKYGYANQAQIPNQQN